MAVRELNSLGSSGRFMFETRLDEEERLVHEAEQRRQAEDKRKAEDRETIAKAQLHALTQALPESYNAGFKDGWDQGWAAAIEAARTHADAYAAEAMTNVAKRVAVLGAASDAGVDEARKLAVRVATTVAKKLAGNLVEKMPAEQIEEMMTEILGGLTTDRRLVLRVHPDLVESFKARMQQLVADSGFTGTLEINADPALPITDCRLAWIEGGAERIYQDIVEKVEHTVARYYDLEDGAVEDMPPPVDVDGAFEPTEGEAPPPALEVTLELSGPAGPAPPAFPDPPPPPEQSPPDMVDAVMASLHPEPEPTPENAPDAGAAAAEPAPEAKKKPKETNIRDGKFVPMDFDDQDDEVTYRGPQFDNLDIERYADD